MSDCRCRNPPFHYRDYVSRSLGIDTARGRGAEVTLETCVHCGTHWLKYLIEHEAFTASGRWFRAPVPEAELATLTADTALAFLERQPWHFYGGSFYRSTGARFPGPLRPGGF